MGRKNMAEFDLDIYYIIGLANIIADRLLWLPVTTELHLISYPIVHQSLVDLLYIVAMHIYLYKCIGTGMSIRPSHTTDLTMPRYNALHLYCGMFTLHKHMEYTFHMCSMVFYSIQVRSPTLWGY